MIDWLQKLDLVSLTLGAVLGALLSTWLNFFVTQPKIRVVGGGGGGGSGRGFHQTYISLANPPALLGIKLGGSTIFGWRVHGRKEWGLVIDRSPARECRALLLDKQTGQHIRPLWWRTGNGAVQSVTLKSGEQAQLMLFARLDDEPLKYFVYQVDQEGSDRPVVPLDDQKFAETREFRIEIRYSHGKKFKTDMKVVRGFDGRLSYQTKASGGSF